MKIKNNIDYNNKTELQRDITNILERLYYEGIDKNTYNELESFRNNIHLARERYDKERIKK